MPLSISRFTLLIFALLCLPVTVLAAGNAAEVSILSSEFGLFAGSDPRETNFTPGRVVPHVAGQRYGWTIELRTHARSVAVQEEYLLAPQQDAAAAADGITRLPRRNTVSQRQLVPVNGKIWAEWAVGDKEPAGKRRLQVLVEGQVAALFDFEVK